MKSHVLLTIALFLISAPAPDGGDIAEITSNLIVPTNQPGLSAAETSRGDASNIRRESGLDSAKLHTSGLPEADVVEAETESNS